jgi:glutamate transport system permease protein
MSPKPSMLHRLTTVPAGRPGELSIVEELGPKGRRNAATATAVFLALLVALGAWIVRRFQIKGQFAPELWRPFKTWAIWKFLLIGLSNTLKAAAVAMVLALSIGIVMAMLRTGPKRAARIGASIYVEGFRACALVVLVKYANTRIPKTRFIKDIGYLKDGNLFRVAFVSLILGLTLYYSTVMAEVIRSSLRSLAKGQNEAALSIGLTPGRAQRLILMPQALRRAMPNLVTQSASLLKDTSLGALIVYPELVKSASIVGEFGSNFLQTYIVAGGIYITVIAFVTSIANFLERRSVKASR